MVIYTHKTNLMGVKMENRIKLMISGKKEDFPKKCALEFEQMGFELIFVTKDGLAVLEKISQIQPDIVLMDIFMPGLDAIGVMNAYEKTGDAKKPSLLSCPTLQRLYLRKKSSQPAPAILAIRPFQPHALAERMIRLCGIERGLLRRHSRWGRWFILENSCNGNLTSDRRPGTH